jgi:MFS family permease
VTARSPSRSTTLDDRPIPPAPPPGLFASIRSTRDAGVRLAMAHVDLAKAEAQAIGDEIKKVAALAGIAFAVVIFAVILAVVGTALFLGEWLLGSIGWGVLHGLLLFTAVAVACGLAAIGVSGGRIGGAFVLGLIVAVVVGIGLALALPNRAYASLGDSALPGIEPGVRPLVVGLLVVGAVGLLLGVIGALRGGGVGAVVGGALVGLLLGALSAVDVGPQGGAGIGIALGYVVWIAVMGMDVARTGVDTEALKARFYPKQTIETSKETLAWLQSKMPPGTGS